jgi:hypothetical protein
MTSNRFQSDSKIIGKLLNDFTPMPITKEYVLDKLNETKPSKSGATKELDGVIKALKDDSSNFDKIEKKELENTISALKEYLKSFK